MKPKLVPSIVFRDGDLWEKVERVIREELATLKLPKKGREKPVQLDFLSGG